MSDETKTPDSNVVPMAGKRRKKAPAAQGATSPAKKAAKMDMYVAYAAAMARAPGAPTGFEPTFRVIADSEGKRRPVQVLDGDVVVNIAREAVETEIMRFSHITLATLNLKLESRDAREVYNQWAALETPLREAEIAPVRQMSEAGYTWRRLPWDLVDDGKATPTFDEMMGRTDNAEALMTWIGSLFDANASRQQYVYLHGEGGNGKGRLAAFLAQVFGSAYRSEHFTVRPNNFWTSGLLGARLAVFPDFEATDFPNSGFFKSLTGEDAVRVEQKGRPSFTTNLCCFFMFLANDPPGLNESDANRRRAIYCLMRRAEGELLHPSLYGTKLWDEGATWLARCIAKYQGFAAAGVSVIPTSVESLTEIIDAHEEREVDLVNRWFKLESGLETTPGQLQAIFRVEGLRSHGEQSKFISVLKRRFGIKHTRKARDEGDGSRPRIYKGIGVLEGKLAALQDK